MIQANKQCALLSTVSPLAHTPNKETLRQTLHPSPTHTSSRRSTAGAATRPLAILPVSSTRSHINHEGRGGSQRTSRLPGASCVWDRQLLARLPLITHCHCSFGLVNTEPAPADQIQDHINSELPRADACVLTLTCEKARAPLPSAPPPLFFSFSHD